VALFLLAFCESSFFPVPPDVLLIALAIGARRKAFRYAAICTAGSVLGGIGGYFLGWAAAPLGKALIVAVSCEDFYYTVALKYGENAFWTIAVAGFTPIPYKVFTVTAGIFHDHVPLHTLVLGSLLSRTARFFLVGALIYFFGPPVRRLMDRYFNLLTVVFVVLLAGGIFLVSRGGGGEEVLPDRIEVLVSELSHADPELRSRAHRELVEIRRRLLPGPDFGYDPARGPEDNGPALDRWRAWAGKAAEELRGPGSRVP
jgi:membrane protein YqaA with SNARE-associated domain